MNTVSDRSEFFKILYGMWAVLVAVVCIWPMGLNPIWNGEIVYHRDQYEVMAESLLNGHLYMDIEVSDELMAMENPYDNGLRRSQGVDFKWDHAYYNGHYYMYFGIVPVILVFLPYRIITGTVLTTYHATQVFTALIVLCFFLFFGFLRERFFPKMKGCLLIAFSTAFSLASVWYFAEAPALYCTAISSAVCLMLWGCYFWFRAVFGELSLNRRTALAVLGSLCGALSFGCRPTVALANVLLIPLLIKFVRMHLKGSGIKRVFLILLPYLIVGVLLMLYNYLRFDDPFEFGQAYQLTFYDQHDISLFANLDLKAIFKGFYEMFFEFKGFSGNVPFIKFGGIFIEFPVLLIGIGFLIFSKSVRALLREDHLLWISFTLLFILFFITAFEVIMSPILLERYQSDVVPFAAVLDFILIGYGCCRAEHQKQKRIDFWLFVFAGITCLTAVLLFLVPNDMNYTEYYPEFLPEFLEKIHVRLYYVKKYLLNLFARLHP